MFGIAAFAQSTLAGLVDNNRIQYANNGVYAYVGKSIENLHTRYLQATNGAYSYTGSNSDKYRNSKILGMSGTYAITGINSYSKVFIGDWEKEFNLPDTWTTQSVAESVWTDEIPPLTTWN